MSTSTTLTTLIDLVQIYRNRKKKDRKKTRKKRERKKEKESKKTSALLHSEVISETNVSSGLVVCRSSNGRWFQSGSLGSLADRRSDWVCVSAQRIEWDDSLTTSVDSTSSHSRFDRPSAQSSEVILSNGICEVQVLFS